VFLRFVDFAGNAEQILYMMAHFMSNHISFGKLTATAETGFQFMEKSRSIYTR